jgi:hypothetical protein
LIATWGAGPFEGPALLFEFLFPVELFFDTTPFSEVDDWSSVEVLV